MEVRLARAARRRRPPAPPEAALVASGPDWLRYRTPEPAEVNPRVLTAMAQAGLPVVTLAEVERSLEEVYLQGRRGAGARRGVACRRPLGRSAPAAPQAPGSSPAARSATSCAIGASWPRSSLLTLFFPLLMNFTAQTAVDFVTHYGAPIIAERLIPFLLMVVGFFPISISLVIALETLRRRTRATVARAAAGDAALGCCSCTWGR